MEFSTDSYKFTHHTQNPPGTEIKNSYIEARGGAFGYVVAFGLQAYIQSRLKRMPQTMFYMKDIIDQHIGLDIFNRDGWLDLIKRHKYLPLVIEAVPEGTLVPHGHPLVQVRNTDPRFPWLPAFVETDLLRAIWYPSTVATLSREIKTSILAALDKTSDDPDGQIDFKLHDFGARGASSSETAALGGMAHLVNFKGTDTIEALIAARRFYGADMAGYSIPASEHSTVTAWGRNGEAAFVRNMIKHYGKRIFAVVGDSYDIFNFCENVIGGDCKAEIEAMGGTVVVRPDSGDPAQTCLEVLKILMGKFGTTLTSKGYRVLPACVRVIQGDGVNYDSIQKIMALLIANNISIDNIAFGMGGALLQNVNRDTCQFAMKTSAAYINGEWVDIYKDPVGDKRKTSKRGILGLRQTDHGLETYRRHDLTNEASGGLLQEVWRNGRQVRPRVTLDEVRARAAIR